MDGYEAFVHSVLSKQTVASSSGVTVATAFTEVINNTTRANNYTATTSFTAAGGANNCLMARVSFRAEDELDITETVVDYGGQTMTLVVHYVQTNSGSVAFFRLMNPPTTANVDLTINFYRSGGSPAENIQCLVVALEEFTGVHASSPIGQTASNGSIAAADPALPITPDYDNSVVLHAFSRERDTSLSTRTAGADTTRQGTGETGTGTANSDITWMMAKANIGTAAAITCDVTDNATEIDFATAAAELRPA